MVSGLNYKDIFETFKRNKTKKVMINDFKRYIMQVTDYDSKTAEKYIKDMHLLGMIKVSFGIVEINEEYDKELAKIENKDDFI